MGGVNDRGRASARHRGIAYDLPLATRCGDVCGRDRHVDQECVSPLKMLITRRVEVGDAQRDAVTSSSSNREEAVDAVHCRGGGEDGRRWLPGPCDKKGARP